MTRKHLVGIVTLSALISTSFLAGCGESRSERMARELSYDSAGRKKGNPADDIKKIPPHPDRDAMAPLLSKLFTGQKLPNVVQTEIVGPKGDRFPYELTAGVLAVVRLNTGLSPEEKAKAIIRGTAEADAWVFRDGRRKNFAEHIHKVMRSFSPEESLKVRRAYSDLKLLEFFNSKEGQDAVNSLSGAHQSAAKSLMAEFTSGGEDVWKRWMEVKMYARREVAGDLPFKPLLKSIRKTLGHKEPEPVTWDQAYDPQFATWAKEIEKDAKMFEVFTNLRDLQPQEEFKNDTHTMWLVEGSSRVPEKAKKVKMNKRLGFGVFREDLGGGYNEMIFVFSKKMKGSALKRAYLQSQIYRHLFSDFQLLATAGNDFEGKIVPDKYDPVYAECVSGAALDTFITHFKSDYPFLSDVSPKTKDEAKILDTAHKCVIDMCSPDIKVPDPKNEMDVEGPAPGTRLGIFQMLARFEKVDFNASAFRQEVKKDDDELDAEAFLKANPNQHQ